MSQPLNYAVFGAGSWATAIVKMLCENLDEVGWYMRSAYTKEHLLKEQHNPSYLSSVEFKTEQLKLSNDINEIAEWADILIFVIPSAFIHNELQKLTIDISSKTVVSAVKGIMPETGKLVGEHFHDVYEVPFENIAVIAGPTQQNGVTYTALLPDEMMPVSLRQLLASARHGGKLPAILLNLLPLPNGTTLSLKSLGRA